jgi:DNA-binding LacI/PurR family transcriptional regulator
MTADQTLEIPDVSSRRRPLYQRLMAAMRERIDSGQLRPGEKAPSESDLIAEFRVSSTTARRCLDELERLQLVRRVQGKGTFVTESATLAEHGQIGILYNELFSLGEGICSHIFRGAGQALEAGDHHGVLLAAGSLRRTGQPAAALREMALRNKLQGILVMSPLPAAWLQQVLDEGLPVASINFAYEDPRIYSAVSDGGGVGRRIADRLIQAGHRHVVSVRRTFPPELLEGVRLSSWGLGDEPALDWRVESFPYFGPDQTPQVVDRCLDGANPPTAFVAVGYEMALKIRHAVKARNLSIPEDISLMYVGAPPGPSEIDGEIAPIEEMSAWAAQTLLDLASAHRVSERVKIFPSRPQTGSTFGPIRKFS